VILSPLIKFHPGNHSSQHGDPPRELFCVVP